MLTKLRQTFEMNKTEFDEGLFPITPFSNELLVELSDAFVIDLFE